MTLGGRAAEDIIFGKISTGAQNDLERVTRMAYAMVTIYGMNDKIGHVSFNDPNGEFAYSKPYSEKTSEMIDQEVRGIIQNAYDRTKQLLTEKRTELENLAQELLRKEILFQYDLESIVGKRPFDHKTNYENYMDGDNNTQTDAVITETQETASEPTIVIPDSAEPGPEDTTPIV
jgi:cell division protease FtsH